MSVALRRASSRMAGRSSSSVTCGNSSTPDGIRKHLKPTTPAAHVGDAPVAYLNRGGFDSVRCDDVLTSDDEIVRRHDANLKQNSAFWQHEDSGARTRRKVTAVSRGA